MAWAQQDLTLLVNTTSWITDPDATQMFAVSSIFLGLRSYSRIRIVGVGLRADDWVLVVGWVFLLITTAVTSWMMVQYFSGGTVIYLGRIHQNLQSIALGVTKTSFGITLLRLMPSGWQAKVIWATLITMNLQFAIHIIATWQKICGTDDQHHISGDKCWHLYQSVTFSVFSAAYSAACDFILALLPWRMIFNLQMKQSDRIGVAVALSMGVLAGIMGVMKAVQGTKLTDVMNPDCKSRILFPKAVKVHVSNTPSLVADRYIQCVYWVWAMSEPNVTIISASIPVLRGFMRNPRTRSGSKGQKAGTYLKTGDNSTNRFYNRSVVTSARPDLKDHDNASDSSILGESSSERMPRSEEGITWTHEVTVEYETQPVTQMKGPRAEEYELDHMGRR
ncbi:hypothetical protein F66182_6661 [Fusarium sp. NRRL 66182]|nr:hypothetical protein F66182_6661 [Fusarium sp. NRRL 66182]